MRTSYRSLALQKYYKEDLLGVLREFVSVKDIQQMIHLDINNQVRLLEILEVGMKKEDLNVILYNSRNIPDEVLENFKRPVHHRIPMILFRDTSSDISTSDQEISPFLGGTSKNHQFNHPEFLVSANFLSEPMVSATIIPSAEAGISESLLSQNILLHAKQGIFNPHLQENILLDVDRGISESPLLENILSEPMVSAKVYPPAEAGIFDSPLQENIHSEPLLSQNILLDVDRGVSDSTLLENIHSESLLSQNILLDVNQGISDSPLLENILLHVDRGVLGTHVENNCQRDIPNSLVHELDFSPPPSNISEELDQEEIHTKMVNTHKSLLENSLYKIKERKLQEELFQKKLQGLVKKKQERYETVKPNYQSQDKNYQFMQKYVVPMAKYYNVPMPPLANPNKLTLADFPRRPKILYGKNN